MPGRQQDRVEGLVDQGLVEEDGRAVGAGVLAG
jgi:hypothetical protein